jgi:glutamyl/glutaminyl-tRNA synthetase
MPIRAALTGKVHGPELDTVFAIPGKDAALKRMKRFIGQQHYHLFQTYNL